MERSFSSALFLFAHPDDVEFGCGGTVAKWAAGGCAVHYVVITDGSAGDNTPGADRAAVAAVRETEQRAAASILGVASVTFLGETDGHLEVTPDTRRKVCREVRRLRPEVLVAPDPSRLWSGGGSVNHWDHKQAGLLGLTAVMPDAPSRPMFPELLDEGLEPYEVPNLYLSGPEVPDTFVDVTDTFDRKLKALAAHVSQGTDAAAGWITERAEELAAQSGMGARYAESFKAFRFVDDEEGALIPMDDDAPMHDPMDEPTELTSAEREDIAADLEDLEAMRTVFQPQGAKGVVIACQDCGQNHFYEWELLRENLEHMLSVGEPRMHEPAWGIAEDEYIQWDYGKGYIDALGDTGLRPGSLVEVTQCPWCETPFEAATRFCPRCGRQLGAVRLYADLLARGFDERDARAMLVRAGYEPF